MRRAAFERRNSCPRPPAGDGTSRAVSGCHASASSRGRRAAHRCIDIGDGRDARVTQFCDRGALLIRGHFAGRCHSRGGGPRLAGGGEGAGPVEQVRQRRRGAGSELGRQPASGSPVDAAATRCRGIFDRADGDGTRFSGTHRGRRPRSSIRSARHGRDWRRFTEILDDRASRDRADERRDCPVEAD